MADFRYPKKWQDMSLDMRLMSGYHISMMVMMLAGGILKVRHELAIAGVIVALVISVSRYNRQKKHWRWPGTKMVDVLYAVGGIFAVSIFLFSASPLFPPNNGHIVPWYLAGLGIGLFGVLQSLNVVSPSEAGFVSNCMVIDVYGREIPPVYDRIAPQPSAPSWKRFAKTTYAVAFMLLWVCGVASFYFFGTAFKNGSPEPTATQTEPLQDHGKTVYVTSLEKQRVHSLRLISGVGFPVVLISGVILHFVMGVKLLPNVPTLSEYFQQKKSRATHN